MKVCTRIFALMASISYIVTSTASAETVTYYVADHLGSPVVAMDTSGTVLWRESYNPYGAKRENPSSADNDTGYTGHQFDAATDLTYMQARYYDPVVGRFMGVDPVQFEGGNPGQFGRYLYANNNPVKYVDPDGREALTMTTVAACIGPHGVGCAAIAAGAVAVGAVGYTAYKAGGAIYKYATDIIYNAETTEEDTADDGESAGEDGDEANNERNPAQDKPLSNGEVKALTNSGIHPHELKPGGSKQDLFKDKEGNIYVKPKDGSGPGDPTGININDFK